MPTDPRRVKDLFVAALDLPEEPARRTFLDRECGDDAELRRRLDVLLAAHDRPDAAVDQPLAAPDANAVTRTAPPADNSISDPTAVVGAVVAGRYKLLERIGEGGMGTVWMAEQREPVKRLVAVKLIKAGMDSRAVLARFEAERQALALMDHPNIAKVLDGGTTAEGRPYFVMELVKGLPLTEYCDARRLSVRDRLELFGQVCSAVQHAHQKGVIHRDLKPTNVLVTEHDGKPVPKVIDFGLAKALTAGALTDKTLHTAFGAVVGTPLYMAPEQVGINALDVDTRTDIYALGVILYELLTGTTPLEKRRLREAAWDEMRRLIREEEPPRPSVRLSSSVALPSLAAGRQIEPARLTKLVRGELDWIVMKALEKDRNRRYETANGLAMDVRRYLAGDAVLAVPPSAGYRLRKFARRYKKPLITAAVFVLLLVSAAVVSTWQAVRATAAEREARRAEEQVRDERDRAVAAEQQATAEKANTQAALDFFWNDLLSQASPGGEPERDLTVWTLLDRAADRLERGSGQPPMVEAAVRQMIGVLYADLGEYAKARRLLERALEIRRRALGEEDPQTLATTHALGRCLYLQARDDDASRFDEANRFLGRTLELRQRVLGEEHDDALCTTRYLGECLSLQGREEEGERLLAKAVQTLARLHGEEYSTTILTMTSLTWTLERRGKHAEATALGTRCVELSRRSLGEDHEITWNAILILARIHLARDDAARAEPLAAELLQACRRTRGNRHPITLYAIHFLARVYYGQGRYADATPLAAELLAERRKQARSDDRFLATALQMLGQVLLGDKKYAEAEPYLRECLAIRSRQFSDSWFYFNTQSHLGGSLLGQKKYAEAEAFLRQGYAGLRQREARITIGDRIHLTEAVERLVQLYDAWGKPDEAAKWRVERGKYPPEQALPPQAVAP